jgi:dihydrofolate reductase
MSFAAKGGHSISDAGIRPGAGGHHEREAIMSRVRFNISVSLDGYAAGPDPGPEAPLGQGGMRLHEWVFGLRSWREAHGEPGGGTGPDDDVVAETIAGLGAVVMGRKMFDGGEGPWGDQPSLGWWGETPPFHRPVFVVTSHPRDTVSMPDGTSYTFVTGGVEAAIEQAKAAAGGLDVQIGGGASVIQQAIAAGLVDQAQLHVVPVLLGDGGVRLLDRLGTPPPRLEIDRVIASPAVTHLRYRILR